ncbi:MAG: hypothetical protein ACOYD6_08940 [Limnochordia bacterium]|jgi:hypothetical protein
MKIWLFNILKTLTSDLIMEPLIVFLVGYGVKQYNSGRRQQVIVELVIDIVDYIEEHYKEWGIRGSKKMDRFLEMFTEEFKRRLGKPPTPEEIQAARIKAEGYVQRARRMQIGG